ncbi:MAG TPA: dienelactone hydrolase family protein [Candidatus Paceibacterota bacterium]|mgnify:FL=1|nr:dienelactone hydrolase family protein [Candidatus Paceibacterota bacterium]
MLSKKFIFLLVVLILIGSIGFFPSSRVSVIERESDSNNDLISEEKVLLEVITVAELEYFLGAKGYFVRPTESGNYPGIVMVHENRGLRPEIKATAESLAKEGYLVLAVDLFGAVAEDQDGARLLTASFDQEEGTENMRAAAKYLREQGAGKMASLGWCFGGRQSVELATSGEKLDATIVYYGGGISTSTEVLQPISWPVLGIFGDEDQWRQC